MIPTDRHGHTLSKGDYVAFFWDEMPYAGEVIDIDGDEVTLPSYITVPSSAVSKVRGSIANIINRQMEVADQ